MAEPSDTSPGAAPEQQSPIPLFYTNGFEMNASLSDFGILFMYDGRPVMRLALSFTTTKTLVAQLQGGIESFEAATGQPLLTMEDVAKGYQGLAHGKSSD